MATLSLTVDPSGAEQGGRRVVAVMGDVKKSSAAAEVSVERFSRSAANTNQAVNRISPGLRNLSLQLSQVAQQATATGDPIRALAIQLPDIGLSFGAAGIAIGAAAGALLPFITNLGSTESAGRAAENAMKDLQSSLDFVQNELRVVADLQESYQRAVVRGQDKIAASLLEEIELRGDLLKFRRLETELQLNALESSLEDSQAAFQAVLRAASDAAQTIQRDVINEEFTRTQAQESALAAVRRVLDQNKSVTLEYQKQQVEADLIKNQIEQIDVLLARAAGGANDLAGGLGNAASEAAAAAATIQQIFDRENNVYSGRGSVDPRNPVVSTLGEDGIQEIIDNFNNGRRRLGRVGSRNAAVDTLRDQFDNLLGSLDPVIRAEQRFEEQQELLNKALRQGVISSEEFANASDLIKERLEEATEGSTELRDDLSQTFADIVTGAQSAEQALYNLFQQLANRRLTSFFDDFLSSVGFANGGVFESGAVQPFANGAAFHQGALVPFANGGVVSSPTFFPMASGQTGLMGEAGPEAILPLRRGRGGRLGVEAATSEKPVVNVSVVNAYTFEAWEQAIATNPRFDQIILNIAQRVMNSNG